MPESMSLERRRLLKALGAELVLTPAAEGMAGAVRRAEELVQSDKRYFIPQQFKNPANPEIHRQTTAEEIWRDTAGKVDIFVAGVGTGGTITGVGEVLKARNPHVQIVAVEPAGSPVITQHRAGQPTQARQTSDSGDRGRVHPEHSECERDRRSCHCHRRRRVGNRATDWRSSKASCAASAAEQRLGPRLQVASRPDNRGKLVVVVLPDLGERYLSTRLFPE